jgi:hypothetical protein
VLYGFVGFKVPTIPAAANLDATNAGGDTPTPEPAPG